MPSFNESPTSAAYANRLRLYPSVWNSGGIFFSSAGAFSEVIVSSREDFRPRCH